MSGIERVFATLLLAGAVAGAFVFPRLLAGGGTATGRLGLIPHGTGLTVVSAAPPPTAKRHPGLTFVAAPLVFSPHAVVAQAVTAKHGGSRPVHALRPQRATTPSPVAAAPSSTTAKPAPEPVAQPVAQPVAKPVVQPQPQPVAEPVSAPVQPSVAVSRVVVKQTSRTTPMPVPVPVQLQPVHGTLPAPVSPEIPLVVSLPPPGESGPIVRPPGTVVPPPTESPDDTDGNGWRTESARMGRCPASASSAPAP